jgi:cephalosporin hydroxylase
MKTYRKQSFQRFKPKLNSNGYRSQFVDAPVTLLRRIQRGTMNYYWRGVMCNKNPFDLALYTKLLWELRPKTIIEIGYKFGGSSLWFADQTYLMNLNTKIVAIDINQREKFSHQNIIFLKGDGNALHDCLTKEILLSLQHPWLIVDDADHHFETSFNIIKFFYPYMTTGDYLCVEDGLCDTTGNVEIYNGGPNLAIFKFLEENPDIFEVDEEYCDFFGNNMTWCTNGWLRRI